MHVFGGAHVKIKEQLWELGLSFRHVGFLDQTQELRFCDKCLYYLNCLASGMFQLSWGLWCVSQCPYRVAGVGDFAVAAYIPW